LNKKKFSSILILFLLAVDLMAWGFYSHRLINRKAIYALPIEMFAFYKANLDYLEFHAVDPDKRRYSVDGEAPKHYIDLDRYVHCVDCTLDSIQSRLPIYWSIEMDSLLKDSLEKGGVLPWNLAFQVRLLTKAFEERNAREILRLSAEIGHYASDAHVPLHTTENYNGQLTNQHGIHALWESRIPERFAANYWFLSGQASYFQNVQISIWKAVIESHRYVSDVLENDRELRSEISSDRVFSAKSIGRQSTIDYSEKYIERYEAYTGDLVERRMTESSHFVASLWFTAWVDAGQPNLSELDLSGCQFKIDAQRKNDSVESEPEHIH
jgi:hypothetical protein